MITNTVDRALLDAGRDLRIVANAAVGYNNVDVAAARERGIIVTNTPDVLTEATADFTWALILGITRRLGEGERLVRRGGVEGMGVRLHAGDGAARQAARHRRLRPHRPGRSRPRGRVRHARGRTRRVRAAECRSTACSRPRTSCRCTCR